MDCFRIRLKGAYTGSKQACPYTLTHVLAQVRPHSRCGLPLLPLNEAELLLLRRRARWLPGVRRILPKIVSWPFQHDLSQIFYLLLAVGL